MTRVSALAAHLRQGASKPFVWGQCDCVLFVCDWIKCQTGLDPAAPHRLRYRNRSEAAQLIRRHDGLAGLVDHCLAEIGLTRIAEPMPGDVAVIDAGDGHAFALCVAPARFAGKSRSGVAFVEAPQILAAWHVPEPA